MSLMHALGITPPDSVHYQGMFSRRHEKIDGESKMDLRQLRYFVAIVEQGSFAKAATSLNIAQPSLSNHVRNMETDLKTELLPISWTGSGVT